MTEFHERNRVQQRENGGEDAGLNRAANHTVDDVVELAEAELHARQAVDKKTYVRRSASINESGKARR